MGGRRVHVARVATLPDPLRIARYRRAPELGPRILFFSGGTALRKPSRILKGFTHNSVHVMTPFDSGGSSAGLRRAFGMPAPGDLRNRLVALADETVQGNPEIYRLFAHRLPKDQSQAALAEILDEMVAGRDPLVATVPMPIQRIIRTHLRHFVEAQPGDFDLRGASIGNLWLTGAYLNNERDMASAVFLFSQLVGVRGFVRPVVEADLHLAATLANGETVVGQHLLTGKEHAPIPAAIEALSLVEDPRAPTSANVDASDAVLSAIASAELICFPMGSFYSSVVANLLPRGVGAAVARADCPKIYVANTGVDPEQKGHSVGRCIETLLRYLRADAGQDTPTGALLNLVLVDPEGGEYPEGLELDAARRAGVGVVELALCDDRAPGVIDAQRLVDALLSLV